MITGEIRIAVRVSNGMEIETTAGLIPSHHQAFHFKSIDWVSDKELLWLNGAMPNTAIARQEVLVARADMAKFIARDIALHLVKEMRKNDTVNGYKVDWSEFDEELKGLNLG